MLPEPSSPGGAPARAAERARNRAPWVQALLLAVAVALCYANSLRVPFLFDDHHFGSGLGWRTRPLVWASFDLSRALGGGVVGYHVVNVLVHLACGLVLLGVLRRALPRAAPELGPRTRDGLAFVTTLLWLCHPLQTAAVTYISQRAEALAALAVLAVLYAFLLSLSAARPRRWQALALLALALGFATKEIVATAPVLVWLFDAVCVARGPFHALRARRGFYAALALVTFAGVAVFVVPPLLQDETMGLGFEGFGALDYARTQPGVLLHYLRLAFWPDPLVFDYGWPIAREAREWVPQTATLLVLLAGTVVMLLRRSWIGYAGAFFFVVLAPTSSFVPIKDAAFEHRVYLPLAAVLVLAVAGGRALLARTGGAARVLVPLAALGAALALGVLTVRRNRDYRSAVELWRLTAAEAPQHARAHEHLGAELLAEERPEEALAALREAVRLDPELGAAHMNVGIASMSLGRVNDAIPAFERAAALRDDAGSHDALGNALATRGDHAGAARELGRAAALRPDDAGLHFRLAKSLARLARDEEALHHYAEAARLDPGLQEAHIALSGLYAERGETDAALTHALAARAIDPDTAPELFRLGKAFRAVGRLDEALETFAEAGRLAPDVADPLAAWAETVCMKPDSTEDERREALRLALRANDMTHATRKEFRALVERAQALVDGTAPEPERATEGSGDG